MINPSMHALFPYELINCFFHPPHPPTTTFSPQPTPPSHTLPPPPSPPTSPHPPTHPGRPVSMWVLVNWKCSFPDYHSDNTLTPSPTPIIRGCWITAHKNDQCWVPWAPNKVSNHHVSCYQFTGGPGGGWGGGGTQLIGTWVIHFIPKGEIRHNFNVTVHVRETGRICPRMHFAQSL